MSDYQRITMREFAGVTGDAIYNRLAELEDKIESGELIPAAEYESAIHRAEVVERAFDNIIKVFHEMLSTMFPDIKIDFDEWKKDNLANAEKELAEEGKQ